MRHFENLPTRKTGVERDTTGLAFKKLLLFAIFHLLRSRSHGCLAQCFLRLSSVEWPP